MKMSSAVDGQSTNPSTLIISNIPPRRTAYDSIRVRRTCSPTPRRKFHQNAGEIGIQRQERLHKYRRPCASPPPPPQQQGHSHFPPATPLEEWAAAKEAEEGGGMPLQRTAFSLGAFLATLIRLLTYFSYLLNVQISECLHESMIFIFCRRIDEFFMLLDRVLFSYFCASIVRPNGCQASGTLRALEKWKRTGWTSSMLHYTADGSQIRRREPPVG